MRTNIYVGLSSQIAQMRRLEGIARNVANMTTPGYRAERVSFEEVLSDKDKNGTSFVAAGATHLSTSFGPIEKTGNSLDVAISGDAWFGVSTPSGLVYSRDGRFTLSEEGNLISVTGGKLVDVGGTPLQIEAQGSAVAIAKDGSITQEGRVVGTIGLFRIPDHANLRRSEGASVVPDTAAEPQIDFNSVSIAQGYLERSNVEPVMEMTRLISLQRSFDATTNAMSEAEDGVSNAIRTLGA